MVQYHPLDTFLFLSRQISSLRRPSPPPSLLSLHFRFLLLDATSAASSAAAAAAAAAAATTAAERGDETAAPGGVDPLLNHEHQAAAHQYYQHHQLQQQQQQDQHLAGSTGSSDPRNRYACGKGASIYYVRKIFGILDPLPPCSQSGLIYKTKFTQPPLLH